jgi:hypothetical protein
VLQPIPGFYRKPVAVLDYTSLYPSIMIAYNMCFTTILLPHQVPADAPREGYARLADGTRYVAIPLDNGSVVYFVQERQGVIPRLLQKCLKERKDIQRQMKTMDPSTLNYQLLDCLQAAKKRFANSIYGFFGQADRAPSAWDSESCSGVPDKSILLMAISNAVTVMGQTIARASIRNAEEKFGAQAVYGDTDSIFLVERDGAAYGTEEERNEAALRWMDRAHEIADSCTNLFPRPIHLKFEKVYTVMYIGDCKKHYAGMMSESPGKVPYTFASKGGVSVKRSFASCVRQGIATVYRRTIQDLVPLDQLLEEYRQMLLSMQELPLAEFAHGVQLASENNMLLDPSRGWRLDNLKKTPQFSMVWRMRERNPTMPSLSGQIVMCVYRKPDRIGQSQCDLLEDLEYMEANGGRPHLEHYIESIHKNLESLIRICFGDRGWKQMDSVVRQVNAVLRGNRTMADFFPAQQSSSVPSGKRALDPPVHASKRRKLDTIRTPASRTMLHYVKP